jgi:hypothetical protein
MKTHIVKQGDCILSLAEEYGVAWKKLWELPENRDLKNLRKDPSVLYPGDAVVIPPLEIRLEDRSTDKRHRFAKKADAAKIKIRVLEDDIPKAYQPFILKVDGKKTTGRTDGGGFLEARILPGAVEGLLEVGSGTERRRFPLKLGFLDPIDSDSGFQQRLIMLGLEVGDELAESVRAFQHRHKLQETGLADDATRGKLKEEFGQ